MSEFEPAIANTELWEGGYSSNPKDPGGETYRGISRRAWPKWAGWSIIDRSKSFPNFPAVLEENQELQGLVIEFYRVNYWQYTDIEDQDIANHIFDLAVNIGTVHCHKIVQGALNLPQDGIFGPHTIASINSSSKGSLLSLIRMAAENYYKEIVQSHPEDAIFLKGWLRRVDS